jgi:hypothetical protein
MFACASLLGCAALGCMPLTDLDSYHAGTSGSGGNAGSQSALGESASGATASSGSETEPTLGDTALDLPVNNPESAALDAGSGEAWDASDAALSPCTGNAEVVSGDRCYLLTTEVVSWLVARQACRAWGGHLTVVGSAAEDAWLSQHLLANTWLGLNDIVLEGTFFWDGGADATYRNWGATEPNNESNSDCVEKRSSDGLWYDQSCALAKAYACEKALQ